MCVYWSSRSARANVDVRALHQIAKEIETRIEKGRAGDERKIDSRSEMLSTASLPWLALPPPSYLYSMSMTASCRLDPGRREAWNFRKSCSA